MPNPNRSIDQFDYPAFPWKFSPAAAFLAFSVFFLNIFFLKKAFILVPRFVVLGNESFESFTERKRIQITREEFRNCYLTITKTHINNTTYTLTKPFWKILPSKNRMHLSVERKYRSKLELREKLRVTEKDIMFNFPV